jgi:DNA-binding transcriptional LysR family regulator
MSPSVDPNDLALFAHVADAGSFTRAADKLGLPKSTLSRRLSGLETLLGERLILRTTRRLTVTEFGAAVLEHARQVVAEVDGALALARHRQSRPSGHLRVSMPADVAMLSLREALAAFVREHPAVTLELDLSPRRVDLIAENVDLALRMGDLPDDSHLAARRLAWFTSELVASPAWLAAHGTPAHPADLTASGCAMHALVVGARSGEPRPWRLERHDDAGQVVETWQGLPARRTIANAPALLMDLARAGVGLALVADFFAAPQVAAGELVRVLPAWRAEPVPAWAVFPERRLMPAKTRVFLEMLATALAPCLEHRPPAG